MIKVLLIHLSSLWLKVFLVALITNQGLYIDLLLGDETMVNWAGLTHWSRQEGLIPFSRRSLAGSPVIDLLHKETSRDS
ncbi:hypothetical protein Hanom_Chr11g01010241 [Helianthus anomalus]